jgi:hypothetical protein
MIALKILTFALTQAKPCKRHSWATDNPARILG